MDTEKEIEEMAMSIAECNGTSCDKCLLKCRAYTTCEILHDKGYGNIEQIFKMVAKILYKDWGEEPPCNFNDNDDYMLKNCEDYCAMNCDNPDHIKCWKEWLKAKLKEITDET